MNEQSQKLYDIYETYLDIRRMYKKTPLSFAEYFLRFCEEHSIEPLKLTYDQLNIFLLHLKNKNIMNRTSNFYIKNLNYFYSFLTQSGVNLVDTSILNMIRSIKLLKEANRIIEPFTLAELEKLMGKALTYRYPMPAEKILAIVYFMFFTGVRRRQLVNLSRKDIDLTSRKAYIRLPTKNSEENVVFFTNKVAKVLRVFFAIEPEETNAFNITLDTLACLFKFLKNFTHNNKRIYPHLMRHSFGHFLAEKQVDVAMAMGLFGHKSIQSTLIYYKPTAKNREKIYREKIGE